jgi:hypothetical protein
LCFSNSKEWIAENGCVSTSLCSDACALTGCLCRICPSSDCIVVLSIYIYIYIKWCFLLLWRAFPFCICMLIHMIFYASFVSRNGVSYLDMWTRMYKKNTPSIFELNPELTIFHRARGTRVFPLKWIS